MVNSIGIIFKYIHFHYLIYIIPKLHLIILKK